MRRRAASHAARSAHGAIFIIRWGGLSLEGQAAVALSPVSRVQPRLEVGGRWDRDTAEQGLILELGGGLAYTQTEWG